MNRIDRLFGILTTLQSKKHVTASQLAAQYEISVRTVYRDIKSLEQLGIPVSFEQPKGYYIVQGYFLPPLSFTVDEANSLILMASLAERFADKSIARHSNHALSKIKAVLRSSDKDKTARFSDHINVYLPESEKTENDFLIDVQAAIARQIIIAIDYTDNQNIKTTREIEPIGLVFYNMQWHLIAWCWKRNDYRDFKVKQLSKISCTQQPYKKTDHIQVTDFLPFLK
ncbi:MAG TPA: WYL domain-containing protein [Mucilaginibacter sp.]|nr:WYL domain-containing protein [Mucilaginibacter sp.]